MPPSSSNKPLATSTVIHSATLFGFMRNLRAISDVGGNTPPFADAIHISVYHARCIASESLNNFGWSIDVSSARHQWLISEPSRACTGGLKALVLRKLTCIPNQMQRSDLDIRDIFLGYHLAQTSRPTVAIQAKPLTIFHGSASRTATMDFWLYRCKMAFLFLDRIACKHNRCRKGLSSQIIPSACI